MIDYDSPFEMLFSKDNSKTFIVLQMLGNSVIDIVDFSKYITKKHIEEIEKIKNLYKENFINFLYFQIGGYSKREYDKDRWQTFTKGFVNWNITLGLYDFSSDFHENCKKYENYIDYSTSVYSKFYTNKINFKLITNYNECPVKYNKFIQSINKNIKVVLYENFVKNILTKLKENFYKVSDVVFL